MQQPHSNDALLRRYVCTCRQPLQIIITSLINRSGILGSAHHSIDQLRVRGSANRSDLRIRDIASLCPSNHMLRTPQSYQIQSPEEFHHHSLCTRPQVTPSIHEHRINLHRSQTATMSDSRVTLQTLPNEILEKICSQVIKSENPVDFLRVRHSKDGKLSIYSRGGNKTRLNLRSMLMTSSKLRMFAQQWLARESRFSVRSDNFVKFPEAFGRANAALIEHLELEFSFTQKVQHERDWPGLLDMFSTDLQNLSELKLSTTWESGRRPYPENESNDPPGSLSREGQERRNVLRFAAFLILRHLKLRRLIWPAGSGPTFEIDEVRPSIQFILDKGKHHETNDFRRAWGTMEKWVDETRTNKVLCEVSLKKF